MTWCYHHHHHHHHGCTAATMAASLGVGAGLLLLGVNLINYFPAHLVLPDTSNSSCCCLSSTEKQLIMEASRWVHYFKNETVLLLLF